MDAKIVLTLTILGATLLGLVADRERRTLWALLGAALMGSVWPECALGHLDGSILGLYMAMLILATVLRQTGLSQYLALKSAKLVRGRPTGVLTLYSALALVFAALWGSVTAMFLLIPVSLLVAIELDISPLPFVLTEALAATWGSLLTSANDPVTMLVAKAFGVDWITWFLAMGPWVALLAALLFASAPMIFRKSLKVTNERRARIMDFDARRSLPDGKLLVTVLLVLGGVLIGIVTSPWTSLPPALVALAGSAILLLLLGRNGAQIFGELDWSTWILVASLLILAGGVVDSGVLGLLSPSWGSMPVAVLWISALVSSAFDGVTAMAILAPIASNFNGAAVSNPLWVPLALGAALGGGATLWGSAAALTAANLAQKSNQRVSVWTYTKVGLGLGLAGLLLVTGLMAL